MECTRRDLRVDENMLKWPKETSELPKYPWSHRLGPILKNGKRGEASDPLPSLLL